MDEFTVSVPVRRCAEEGCRTVLTVLNTGTKCFLHTEREREARQRAEDARARRVDTRVVGDRPAPKPKVEPVLPKAEPVVALSVRAKAAGIVDCAPVPCKGECGTSLDRRRMVNGLCRVCVHMKKRAAPVLCGQGCGTKLQKRRLASGVCWTCDRRAGVTEGKPLCGGGCGRRLLTVPPSGKCYSCRRKLGKKRAGRVTKLEARTAVEHLMNQLWERLPKGERLKLLRNAPEETYEKVRELAAALMEGVAA